MGGHSPAWDLILVCVYDCVCVVWGWVGWATVTLAAALKARNRGLDGAGRAGASWRGQGCQPAQRDGGATAFSEWATCTQAGGASVASV